MTRPPVQLTAPIDPTVAARLLAEWGFLAHPDLPNQSGDAYLLVALRNRATSTTLIPSTSTCGSAPVRAGLVWN